MADEQLGIQGVIGFSGRVPNGLKYTPCGEFIVYPLGAHVVVKHIESNKQVFLEGHSNFVSCIDVSHDGTKAASGQVTQPGTKAEVIIWDLAQAKEFAADGQGRAACMIGEPLTLHLGKVQDLGFSCDDNYLATLGGQDDNTVVVWDMQTYEAVCGSPAAVDSALTVVWQNTRNDRFVTAGNYHLKVWQVDVDAPRIHEMSARMGNVRRIIRSVAIRDDDEVAYCGTNTGDIMEIGIDRDPIQSYNDPDTKRPYVREYSQGQLFSRGVLAIVCVKNPASGRTNLLVGAGDGTISIVNPQLRRVRDRATTVMGAVKSLSLHPDGQSFIVGTDQANTYWCDLDMNLELRGTCHYGRINDVCFPSGCSDLFVTCSINDIRIWNTQLRQELLRIQVPNLECNCIGITPSGGSIVSGWSDGKIRAFYPESGQLKFVITDAHTENVTALAVCNDNEDNPPWRVVSGGQDGRVRVWSITSSHQRLLASLKEHRGIVNCIRVSNDNSQCVSASADGSCIVWDLERFVRINAMFEPNVFRSILYHPDESQLLTCGSNHKISYWDAYDGNAIRIVDGGDAEMECLDIEPDGIVFVSGGADKLVKVWHYDDGVSIASGEGHSGSVRAVAISPDQQLIVSAGSEGSIFIWTMPEAGAVDLAAEGYVPKANVADEVMDNPEEAEAKYEEKYADEDDDLHSEGK